VEARQRCNYAAGGWRLRHLCRREPACDDDEIARPSPLSPHTRGLPEWRVISLCLIGIEVADFGTGTKRRPVVMIANRGLVQNSCEGRFKKRGSDLAASVSIHLADRPSLIGAS